MEPLNPDDIRQAVRAALAEDIGEGDATTLATIPAELEARAVVRAREPLVVAGVSLAEAAFRELDPTLRLERLVEDGAHVSPGAALLRVTGAARPILGAERTALNFLQRLASVATLTARFVEAVRGTGCVILDTRKTMPGMRKFEKYAVACGGGHNHRFGLYDMVLIKDNHLAALRGAQPNPVAAAIERARAACPKLRVEVEADALEQVRQAVEAGADVVLLDNMSLEELRAAVALARGRVQTEASGGVTLENVRAIAETGVDFISVGALTHSARAVDIAFDFEDLPPANPPPAPAP